MVYVMGNVGSHVRGKLFHVKKWWRKPNRKLKKKRKRKHNKRQLRKHIGTVEYDPFFIFGLQKCSLKLYSRSESILTLLKLFDAECFLLLLCFVTGFHLNGASVTYLICVFASEMLFQFLSQFNLFLPNGLLMTDVEMWLVSNYAIHYCLFVISMIDNLLVLPLVVMHAVCNLKQNFSFIQLLIY